MVSSPIRIWKNIQRLINTNQKDEFSKLCRQQTLTVVHVILTCRLSSAFVALDEKLQATFSVSTEINALELALLQKRDHIAYILLNLLKQHSTPAQYKELLNHTWGNTNNTALYLATFWNYSKIHRLLIDMGAEMNKPIVRAPSFLLKKAEKQMSRLSIIDHPFSPLSFSSSTSNSSSASSSLSSLCWTPPVSPAPSRHFTTMTAATQKQQVVPPTLKKVRFDPHVLFLDTCISGDKDELMDLLDQYPVDLDSIRDIKNRSLLHIALMHRHDHLLDFLYNKININHPDQDGKRRKKLRNKCC
jgi:hypothetical protein